VAKTASGKKDVRSMDGTLIPAQSQRNVVDPEPPQDESAEQSVLGSIILDPSRLDSLRDRLTPSHFCKRAHAKIYATLLDLGKQAGDLTLVRDRLSESGDLEDCGGSAYLADIASTVAVAAHASHYADIVVKKAGLREIIESSEAMIRHAYAGHMTPEALSLHGKTTFERISERATPLGYGLVSAADLTATEHTLRYLIDNILVQGQPCILAGGKKNLKTSILLDLLISLATGGDFLGYFRVNEAATCCLMTGESGLATIQETLLRQAYAAGVDPRALTRLFITDKIPAIESPEHLAAIRRMILDYELDVLAIDPVYLCMDGSDAGNLFRMGAALRAISQVCTDCGVTLILCHHTRKNGKVEPFGAPELEDIAWSGFQEFARQWLLVNRREPYEPGSGEHRLWLASGGSAGHSGLWGVDIGEGTRETVGGRFWEVTVRNGSEIRTENVASKEHARNQAASERQQARLDEDRKRVVKALAKYPAGETAKTIRDTLGLASGRWSVVLASLIEDGNVVPCEIAKPNRKQPYDAFRLAGEDPTHE
jgi:hypothetical protein